MKRELRSALPKVTQEEIAGARFVLLEDTAKWQPPTVLCKGDDPTLVSYCNIEPKVKDGIILPPHKPDAQGRPVYEQGTLYRIDEE